MAIVQEFAYFKAKQIDEAVTLLAENAHAAVLAGGTDLVPNLKDGSAEPAVVVDIKGIAGFDRIAFDGTVLEIGALVTFSDLIASDVVNRHFPVIVEMARSVASAAIRNRATLVGNICSAVPCMDSGPILAVYDAEINAISPAGERTVPILRWFKGNRQTAIRESEIVTSVTIPLPEQRHDGCFVKLTRYKGEDLAQANVAVLALPGNRFRVAFGSVAAVPVRAEKIEKALAGKEPNDERLRAAIELIAQEIAPISDIRASEAYRLHMCKVMFERAIEAASARLHNSGPAYGSALV